MSDFIKWMLYNTKLCNQQIKTIEVKFLKK